MARDPRIKIIHKYTTPDGAEHTTIEMAEQYLLNSEMAAFLGARMAHGDDAQDIMNIISGNRQRFRAWLDACDAMEKAAK